MEVRGQNESLQKSTIVGYFALLSIYNIILLRLAMAIAIRLLSSDIIILVFRDLMLQMLVSYFMIFENESIFDSDSIFYKSTG